MVIIEFLFIVFALPALCVPFWWVVFGDAVADAMFRPQNASDRIHGALIWMAHLWWLCLVIYYLVGRG